MLLALLIAGPEAEIQQIRARESYIILSGRNGQTAFILIAAGARIHKTSTITITPFILDLTDSHTTTYAA